MPIYEYQCDACGHRLEAIQKVSDELLRECPECREPALRKLVSAAGFRLKGTGWYVTDFRDKKPAKKSAESGKDEGKKEKTEKKESSDAAGDSKKTEKAAESSTSGSSSGAKKDGDG